MRVFIKHIFPIISAIGGWFLIEDHKVFWGIFLLMWGNNIMIYFKVKEIAK